MIKDIIHPETWAAMADWAKTQKRVTNRMICERFDLNETRADLVYQALKQDGVIGSMGYVEVKA